MSPKYDLLIGDVEVVSKIGAFSFAPMKCLFFKGDLIILARIGIICIGNNKLFIVYFDDTVRYSFQFAFLQVICVSAFELQQATTIFTRKLSFFGRIHYNTYQSLGEVNIRTNITVQSVLTIRCFSYF